MALPRDESGVQSLGKSWVIFRIADAVVGMITGECAFAGRIRELCCRSFLPKIRDQIRRDVFS